MKKYTATQTFATHRYETDTARKLQEELIRTVHEHGRAVLAITPEDTEADPREVAFSYTVPDPSRQEPVVLCAYPSARTVRFLLNRVAEELAGNWTDLKADTWTQLPGFLGADGELPVRVRLLTDTERQASDTAFTCQANPKLPVALLSVPDTQGHWPDDSNCHPVVALSEALLLKELGSNPELPKCT